MNKRSFIKSTLAIGTGLAASKAAVGSTIKVTEVSAVATLTEEFKMRLITSFGVHNGITVAVPDMLALATKEPVSDINAWMVALKETRPHFFRHDDRKLIKSHSTGQVSRTTFADRHGLIERLQVGDIVQEKRV